MAPTKEKGKSKATGARDMPRATESMYSEDLESNMSRSVQSETEAVRSDAGQGPKRVIRNMEDGRCYLEEEALTDPGKCMDLDAMAGSLVQISLLEGIPALVHLTVRSVALILAQLKMESISETLLKMMGPKVDAMVGKAAGSLTSQQG